ncbi:tetraspanin-18-like isoform X2 [Corythoichthys intestinalis]|uniref:tetraspanin-18-like isoform X2 n=1 Tax=Corythoichthys intestinalis TaxID=161448 RepID=UPI0025A61699|nr:tetraspanin-18-like isoform X2 [Corythoichthys intestinalis]
MMRTRIEPAAYGQRIPNVECADHYPATRYYKKAKIRTQTTGDCLSCIKYTMLVLNTFFVMTGCMFFGVWALTQIAVDSAFVAVLQTKQTLVEGLYFVLGVGIALFIVGFVGCCGALRGNRFLLITFCTFIVLILITEMAGIGLVLVDRGEFDQKTMKATMIKNFQKDGTDDAASVKTYLKAWKAVMRHDCYRKIKDTYDNVLYGGIGFLLVVVICEVVVVAIGICLFRGLQHV